VFEKSDQLTYSMLPRVVVFRHLGSTTT
jgi:hypothetical protein